MELIGVGISDALMTNVELANPILGFADLHVLGDSSIDTGNISFSGAIFGTGDYGAGLQPETCGQCFFKLATNTTTDFKLVVGVTPGNLDADTLRASSPFLQKKDQKTR